MTPLVILDSKGQIVYSSIKQSKKNKNEFIKLSLAEAPKGIIVQNGKRYYAKPVNIKGEAYCFFMDFDFLLSVFGEDAIAAANDLFEIEKFKKEPKQKWSLKALLYMFINSYSELLKSRNIRFEIRDLASPVTVEVPPGAFILCLCLMAQICYTDTNAVKFGFVNNFGRISIYAHCEGERTEQASDILLNSMLEEISRACGFALDRYTLDGKQRILLDLSPIDISLFGLKAPTPDKYIKLFLCYAAMF